MNLLDSVDQWLLAATLPPVSDDLQLSEAQAGWLSTVLLLALAAASLPVGYLADRLRRSSAPGDGFRDLERGHGRHRTRSIVRPGADRPCGRRPGRRDLRDRRAHDPHGRVPSSNPRRVLALFFLAVPLGAALGLTVGGAFAHVTTWQTAFLAVGAPGLCLALLALIAARSSPRRERGVDPERLRLHERVGPSQEDYVDMMVNSSYTYSVFGMTFSSFAFAGLVYWSPTFLTVAKGLTKAQADAPLGLTYLAAAILGTVTGGWLADWSTRTRPRALFVMPGLGMLAAIPFVLAAIYGRNCR